MQAAHALELLCIIVKFFIAQRQGKRRLEGIDVIRILLAGRKHASVKRKKLLVRLGCRLHGLFLRGHVRPAAKAGLYVAHVNAKGCGVLQIHMKGGIFALHSLNKVLHQKIIKRLLLHCGQSSHGPAQRFGRPSGKAPSRPTARRMPLFSKVCGLSQMGPSCV